MPLKSNQHLKEIFHFSIIIIASKERETLLEQCVLSLLDSLNYISTGPLKVKLIIFYNGIKVPKNISKTVELSNESHSLESISLSSKDHLLPSEARNKSLDQTSGDYILFLDDDVQLPSWYFSKAYGHLYNNDSSRISSDSCSDTSLKIDVLGGPDCEKREEKGFQQLFSQVLKSPLVFGHTYYRHNPSQKETSELVKGHEGNLILCHLWFKRSLFLEEGNLFDSRLFRNEENVLLWQLSTNNKNIYYDQGLYVHHQRKKDLLSVIQTYFRSGNCRMKSHFLFPKSFNLFYLLPLFLLVGLIFLPILRIPFKIYLLLLVAESLYHSVKYLRLRNFMALFSIKIIVLLSYVLGNLWSLIEFCFYPLVIVKRKLDDHKRKIRTHTIP